MFVHRSNRMERLVDELARVLATPKLASLQAEAILIQSQGMERWISRELARRTGAFANARFPFPRTFIQECMNAVLGPNDSTQRYERDSLAWTVADLFGKLRGERAMAPVASYLEEDPAGVRCLQLARRVAHLFDQYVVYRPEMVIAWERGRGSDWQPVLWRHIVERLGDGHLASRAARFVEEFSPLFVQRGALPARVSIVGGASLPPLYLRLLGKIAEFSEVHLFALCPTDQYFAQAAPGAELALSSGNDVHPLLASLGGVAAALQHTLESEVRYVDAPADFESPGEDSVLHALQSDLLRSSARDGSAIPFLPSGVDDGSIELFSTHSAMREIEALRERLLGLFDDDPSLRPDDVVVMAPDIESYVPYIEATFDGDPKARDSIPFRIADRSERQVNVAASALLSIFDVLRGRIRASEVLDLLQLEPVRARFGITPTDLPTIARFVHEAGIRWGQDGAHRAEYGLPEDDKNTWGFGLRRLLLGVALADDELTTFGGTVPFDGVSAEDAPLLGRLAELVDTLFSFRKRLGAERSVPSFRAELDALVRATLAEDPAGAFRLRPLYEGFHLLAEQAEAAGFDRPVSLEVMQSLLSDHFEAERHSADFLSGGVTFCALLPLRSIPFRVVCVLGMNDGEFPRVEKHLGFDKIAERPRIGDRSLRSDDRYLFLETLLSARDKLLVSYVGRGIQDNAERPPAVVVSELSSVLSSMRGDDAGGRSSLRPVEHPLQPFSPRYFDGSDPRLVSFSVEHAAGARSLLLARAKALPFFGEALSERQPPEVIELDELVRFFENPARGILRSLGVFLGDDVELVEDREPVEADALERYRVGARLLGADQVDPHLLEEVELARGLLPIGTPGVLSFRQIQATVRAIREAAAPWQTGQSLPPAAVELFFREPQLERPRLVRGGLHRLFPGVQLECRFSKIVAKHELSLWLRHLALCASELGVNESVLVGRGESGNAVVRRYRSPGTARARELLVDFLELYEVGHRMALPLFPSASLSYVESFTRNAGKPDAEERALKAAAGEFHGTFGFLESRDPYVQQAFRERDPISERRPHLRLVGHASHPVGDLPLAPVDGPDFGEVSRRVFEPLLEHREEET